MEKMVVTGGAGFIGSNLGEYLSSQGYPVTIVDDFSTGKEENLSGWADQAGSRVEICRIDINDTDGLRRALQGARYVFHEAAIPSVPRSIRDPMSTNRANVCGTLSLLVAARDVGIQRVIFASSSSVYGDDPGLPKVENRTGRPLSPYALSKAVSEEYCRLFYQIYGLETVRLRYFNVFGPRQDPQSTYAAVIPRFATSLLTGAAPSIYGDGEQTRDFTFVSNVIQANWLAATHPRAAGEVFNIGCGAQTSLNRLFQEMCSLLNVERRPSYEPARAGDVRHSVADVSKAEKILNYRPAVSLREGLGRVLAWYRKTTGVQDVTTQ